MATNGLQIGPHIEELAELKVSHVTLTINAVDPQIGSRVYAWMRDGTRVMHGVPAAELLLQRQLAAIHGLKAKGVTVKVNVIVLPGINESHVAEVARTVAAAGADLLNCIPLYPVKGTTFEDLPPLSPEQIHALRREAETFLPQMSHCTRCRADAVGLLGEAMDLGLLQTLKNCATGGNLSERPYIAVASAEGVLVNLHLGDADRLLIFGPDGQGGFRQVDNRSTPPSGGGRQRWQDLATILGDCRAVLVSGVGKIPQEVLAEAGIRVVLTEGLIADAVDSTYRGRTVAAPRRPFRCGEACSGNGNGCG